MHIITIATDMSLAGVSTTVIALADCLSAQGVRVLVVDLASDITRCLLSTQPHKTIWDLYTLNGAGITDVVVPYRGFGVIPIDRSARMKIDGLCGSAGGWSIDPEAINGPEWAYLLRAVLVSRAIQDQYDICIIDVNRLSGYLQAQAIYAADTVLIPIVCGTRGCLSAASIIDDARAATEYTERKIDIETYRIHPTPRVLVGIPRAREILAHYIQYVNHTYDTIIRYSRYADRILMGRPVHRYQQLYKDMMALSTELIARHNLPVATHTGSGWST